MNPGEDIPADHPAPAAPLLPFASGVGHETPDAVIPFPLTDYLALVDWTGRAIVDGRRVKIPDDLPPLFERLNIAPAQWLKAAGAMETRFSSVIGPVEKLEMLCAALKRRWLRGIRACLEFYRPPPCTT